MADQCLICLSNLAASQTSDRHQLQTTPVTTGDRKTSSIEDGPDTIAHLLPCGHYLHHECLRPWVERANSCPACRASFNIVELCAYPGGPCLTSYAVQDKLQEPDIDPSIILDDDLSDEPSRQPCLLCEDDTDEEHLLICDGCDGACHTYCVDLLDVPSGPWFCLFCCDEGRNEAGTHPRRGRPRTRGQQRRESSRIDPRGHEWARVWHTVLRHTNIDLDFPFQDDDDSDSERMTQHELNEIERRLEVAERTAGATRFRDAATSFLEARSRRARTATPTPESQDEIRAWNAYDKVNQLRMGGSSSSGRKRKSATASPAEPQPAEPQRKLKRPRTRLRADNNDQAPAPRAESSTAPHRRTVAAASSPAPSPCRDVGDAGPSFLQSLLKEVEMAPGSSNQTPQHQEKDPLSVTIPPRTGSVSPPLSSSGSSPSPSPRSRSLSPSGPRSRPASPPPLSSRIEPIWVHRPQHSVTSPTSPNSDIGDPQKTNLSATFENSEGHVNVHDKMPPGSSAKEKSPSRSKMSSNEKKDVQNLVTTHLKPLYRRKEISSEQYTNINRDISRKLYERVGQLGNLQNGELETLEGFAAKEVELAVQNLKAGQS